MVLIAPRYRWGFCHTVVMDRRARLTLARIELVRGGSFTEDTKFKRSPGVGNGNPLFLPGKFHGQRSLAGYSPWVLKRVGHDLEAKQQQ